MNNGVIAESINQFEKMARLKGMRDFPLLREKKGYDVYILPGGLCVPKILENGKYEAVVGVACGEEIKLADKILEKLKLPEQG